jgi:hypothetical protein
MISGRESKPKSHRWYIVSDSLPRPEKFADLDGACLLELRSTGQQTIVPPSIHPSGEAIIWYSHGAPACVSAGELLRAVRATAAAALLARHWPAQGERDNAALALTGALCRAGWPPERVSDFVGAVAAAAGDEEAGKRASKAAAATRRLENGQPVQGWPTLIKLLGERGSEVVARVRDWLGLASADVTLSGRPDDADDLSFRPFPLDALPGPIQSLVAAGAQAIGCDPSYLALPLLVALASAVGNTRRLELKRGWCVPPILWGVIIGESGTCKTAALRLVLKPIRERQRRALERHAEAMKQYRADRIRWERDMVAWKKRGGGLPPAEPEEPRAERVIVSDTTVEALAPILLANPRGLLLARDELAGWIGSFDRYANRGKTSADSANWLSMFNAESIIVDRKTGTPRTIHVPQAAVSVVGGIQPAILRRALGREHRENGLLARLLLTCPPQRPKHWTEDDINPSAEAELARLFDRLYELQPAVGDDGEPRPVLVHLSDEAKSVWVSYYNAHAAEQADLTGDLASAWSKLEEYAARLALVVHYVRWAAGDVANETRLDAASMNAGIMLTNWFKHEARRVYATLDETDLEREQRELTQWIERRGGTVTVRDVQRGLRRLRGPGAAEAALESLVEAGLGRWEDIPSGQQGGRPSRCFRLATWRHGDETYATPLDGPDMGGFVAVSPCRQQDNVLPEAPSDPGSDSQGERPAAAPDGSLPGGNNPDGPAAGLPESRAEDSEDVFEVDLDDEE